MTNQASPETDDVNPDLHVRSIKDLMERVAGILWAAVVGSFLMVCGMSMFVGASLLIKWTIIALR